MNGIGGASGHGDAFCRPKGWPVLVSCSFHGVSENLRQAWVASAHRAGQAFVGPPFPSRSGLVVPRFSARQRNPGSCPFSSRCLCCFLIPAQHFQAAPDSMSSCLSCVQQMLFSGAGVFQRRGEESTASGGGETENANHQAKPLCLGDRKLSQQGFTEPSA